jgi:hypothetical protein
LSATGERIIIIYRSEKRIGKKREERERRERRERGEKKQRKHETRREPKGCLFSSSWL